MLYKRLTDVCSEIFEVAFVPEKENAPGRKRMITKAFAAFGDMTPIPSSHVVARTSKTKGRIDSKSRSAHSIATQKTRAAAPRGITKKRSATKNRKWWLSTANLDSNFRRDFSLFFWFLKHSSYNQIMYHWTFCGGSRYPQGLFPFMKTASQLRLSFR